MVRPSHAPLLFLALALTAAAVTGCDPEDPPGLDEDDMVPRDGGAADDGGREPDAGHDGGSDTDGGAPVDPTEICGVWNAATHDIDEGTWGGSVAACDAGDMDAAWRARALRLMNAYRALADLPDLTLSDERNGKAQECALVLHAADTLSHEPPDDWACWSADAHEAAGRSNIATTPAVQAVSLYMIDPGAGNASTLGHRRWILSNSIGPTGIGSTSDYSCLWTLGGSGSAGAVVTAFPPPGPFPIRAAGLVGLHSFTNLDETGWSIQSDVVNLDDAEVSVTVDGAPVEVRVDRLLPHYGSRWALAIRYDGFMLQVGSTYRVEVEQVELPSGDDAFAYAFTVVDCAR